ncbi:NAD-dependent epimerase/dehydratase family protein [Bdellovibrio sp. HCB185ZH]|uniref:NAD-dependent epimerase/dehydratase family protein n=1 Tax=Bdellovibrio sp. HCB185ZH TaxID=3394235 RepID=UPI0039A558BE
MMILITGASGFIGRHLSRMLSMAGHEVIATNVDITDHGECEKLFAHRKYDVVVHLAGISSVNECEKDISKAFRVNVEGTYRIASLLAANNNQAHFVFPSTGQVYMAGREENREYTESDPVGPSNLYALTKYLAEEELKSIANLKDLSVTALRIFNHVHKSQRPEFFLSSVYHQLMSAQNIGKSVADISVGNIDIKRDFGALGDLLAAFFEVITNGPVVSSAFNQFNISSAVGKNLRELADCLAAKLGMTISYSAKEGLVRKDEPASVVGSNIKFKEFYKWRPNSSGNVEQLVNAFLMDL